MMCRGQVDVLFEPHGRRPGEGPTAAQGIVEKGMKEGREMKKLSEQRYLKKDGTGRSGSRRCCRPRRVGRTVRPRREEKRVCLLLASTVTHSKNQFDLPVFRHPQKALEKRDPARPWQPAWERKHQSTEFRG